MNCYFLINLFYDNFILLSLTVPKEVSFKQHGQLRIIPSTPKFFHFSFFRKIDLKLELISASNKLLLLVLQQIECGGKLFFFQSNVYG